AAGTTNNVVTHDNGLLQTRTIDSKVWNGALVDYLASTTGYLPMYSNNLGTLTNSSIFESGGNVGIGTTSPGAKISLGSNSAGADTAETKISVWDNGTWHWGIGLAKNLAATHYGLGIYAYNTATSSPKLYVEDSGHVGINTVNPVSRLHLVDEVNSIGRGLTISQHTTDAAGTLVNLIKSRGTELSPTAVANGDYTGSTAAKNYDGTTYLTNGLLGYRVTGTVGTNNIPGEWYFAASTQSDMDPYTNGTVRMVINSSGNVGIGTTGPLDKLDVAGAIRVTANSAFSSGAGARFYRQSDLGTTIQGVTGTTSDFTLVTPTGQRLIDNPTGTNNVLLLPVATTGNVGIGTTGPATNLDLTASGAGGMVINQRADAATYSGLLYLKGSTQTYGIRNANGLLSFSYGATVNSGGGTAGMVMDTSGNVGIGTTGPDDKLHVFGTGNQILKLEASDDNLAQLELVGDNTGWAFSKRRGSDSDRLGLYAITSDSAATFSLELVTFLTNGNVGIGTTGPNTKLNIEAPNFGGVQLNAGATGDTTALYRFSTSANGLLGQLAYVGGTNQTLTGDQKGDIALRSEGRILFGSNGDNLAMTITSGNVGIGTTAPGNKLTVVGADVPSTMPTGLGY
ncbi:hypothetical protein COY32_01875, partial [candidate division WWE3 bacterium CG_4_10_14_0_2_um_filter_41_14]